MSLLNSLAHLFDHQSTPSQQRSTTNVGIHGDPLPGQSYNSHMAMTPQTRQLAQIYSQNPQDPRVAHLDPAMFGYGPDPTVRPVSNQPINITGNLGQQYGGYTQGIGIQGTQNPGYIPMQDSQYRRYMPLQNGYDQTIQF